MRRRRLLGDQGVRFLLILPALAVAENHVAHGKLLEHACGDLAREGAKIVLAHVLRAELDVRVERGFRDGLERGVRRADDDVHFLHVSEV